MKPKLILLSRLKSCNEYDLICYYIILHVIKSEYGLPLQALEDADEKEILQD